MAGYLEEYGVADERRNRVIKWLVILVGSGLVIGFVLYLSLPLAIGWWTVRGFMNDLRRQDLPAAYRAWGCAQPCKDYSYNEFLRDWGPKSEFADPAKAKLGGVWPCGGGVIVTVRDPKGQPQKLWYRPDDGSLSFWPWQGCPSRIEAPQGPTSPSP